MGVVYRAIRRRDGVLVALKTIQPAMQSDALELQRFLREAQILRQLQHPHIVGCEAVGEVDGVLFFEMEYVPGLSAFEMIEHCPQPIPFAPCVSLVCQLLAALQTAHQQQFVHRDIKPGNLLIVERDGQDYLKLADFGLARVYQASKLSGLTLDGAFGGTMGFIAPEQITQFRQCLPTSDQYSAAATLYYLLAKAFVYDLWGNLGQQVQQILSTPIVPLTNRRSDLPEGLVRVIHRGLARDPSERYLNAAEFRAALVPFTMGAAQ